MDACNEVLSHYNAKKYRELRKAAKTVHATLTRMEVQEAVARDDTKGRASSFAWLDLIRISSSFGVFALLLVLFLAHSILGSGDSEAVYYFTRMYKDVLVEARVPADIVPQWGKTLHDVGSLDDIWEFLEGSLLHAVTMEQWYNGDPFFDNQYAPNSGVLLASTIVGSVQLRQLRVRNGTADCQVPDRFKGPAYDKGSLKDRRGQIIRSGYSNSSYFLHNRTNGISYCYGQYTAENREDSPLPSSTLLTPPGEGDFMYPYSNASSEHEVPYVGIFGWYGNDGYIVDLPVPQHDILTEYVRRGPPSIGSTMFSAHVAGGECDAKCVIAQLKRDTWLDLASRALVVDFSLYNPALDMFCVVNIVFEMPATGSVYFDANILPYSLSVYNGVTDVRLVVDLLLTLVVVVVSLGTLHTLYRSWRTAHEARAAFVVSGWNVLDVLLAGCFWVIIYMRAYGILASRSFLSHLEATNLSEDTRFTLAAEIQRQSYERYAKAVCSMLMWARMFRFLIMHPRQMLLFNILKKVASSILSFFVILVVLFMMYAHSGFILYQPYLEDYRSFPFSVLGLLKAIGIGLDYDAMKERDDYFSVFYVVSFQFVITLILLNMIVAILSEAHQVENAKGLPETKAMAALANVQKQLAEHKERAKGLTRSLGHASFYKKKRTSFHERVKSFLDMRPSFAQKSIRNLQEQRGMDMAAALTTNSKFELAPGRTAINKFELTDILRDVMHAEVLSSIYGGRVRVMVRGLEG